MEPIVTSSDNIAVNQPLVTIVVLAYNNLKYTKECVESLYQYTSHINFELITIDNGSSDGTKEYFDSLPNQTKFSFPENIGVDKAINYGFRAAKGKYTLNLSNDIVVTYHWLDNLIACMESDEKIGVVAPICNASSNNQQIFLDYHTMDEMQQKAREYNKSNPRLWEERMKLVTYTTLFRTSIQQSLGGFDEDFNPGAYDDDAISFSIRRLGYKLILAKDTFVHHYGSVTFNNEYRKNNLAERNNLLFISKFGVNSWQATFSDAKVINILNYSGKSDINVLGIGSSCGATLLQIKNMCKMRGSSTVNLYYLSENPSNLTDLKTICEYCTHADLSNVKHSFGERQYDYILLESESDKLPNLEELLNNLSELCKQDGEIVCTAANQNIFGKMVSTFAHHGVRLYKTDDNYYLNFLKL
ncbi:MAG: hypothetical protein K0R90_310 [Oscillospiraceae bacterium]|jgi:GT2 family glycosyltransferase|nr:hypothetical protein [Oscillospiraceae bacterium]